MLMLLMMFVDGDGDAVDAIIHSEFIIYADAILDAAAGFIGVDVDAVEADVVDADAVTYADAADDVC